MNHKNKILTGRGSSFPNLFVIIEGETFWSGILFWLLVATAGLRFGLSVGRVIIIGGRVALWVVVLIVVLAGTGTGLFCTLLTVK